MYRREVVVRRRRAEPSPTGAVGLLQPEVALQELRQCTVDRGTAHGLAVGEGDVEDAITSVLARFELCPAGPEAWVSRPALVGNALPGRLVHDNPHAVADEAASADLNYVEQLAQHRFTG